MKFWYFGPVCVE